MSKKNYYVGQYVFYRNEWLKIIDIKTTVIREKTLIELELENGTIIEEDKVWNPSKADLENKPEDEISPVSYLEGKIRKAKKDCPTLTKYSRVLNELALNKDINRAYGREKEVTRLKTILLKKTKPNAILTGIAGCGKTAIIEELAHSFVDEALIKNKPIEDVPLIFDLSLNALISGAKFRGEFEERLQAILTELKDKNDIIVFIDEIHMLNDVGGAEGAVSGGQILKPALSRGEIRCIGATTTEEYNKYLAQDKALKRRFTAIPVLQLSGNEKIDCIKKISKDYSNFFDIKISNNVVEELINIVNNIIPDTTFPDNVCDILDETLAQAKFNDRKTIKISDIKAVTGELHGILVI